MNAYRDISDEERGFTLLEVMASLAILGFGILLVIELFSRGLATAKSVQDSTAMAMLAGEKMSETLSRKNITEVKESGSDNGFSWSVNISALDTQGAIDNPKLHAYKVVIDVAGTTRRKGAFRLTSIKTVIE